jgi:uncharacterized protein (DUF433 family)
MEARITDRFIKAGISALRVRHAIILARDVLGQDHPLSTNRFKTDGRNIFLRTTERNEDGKEREQLLNLFKGQYEFTSIIAPMAWWPAGEAKKIIVDPTRSFGQPIDTESGIPVAILANAGKRHGVDATAKSYEVPKASVRRAMQFVGVRELSRAA